MSTFLDLVQSRFSQRRFDLSRPVESEKTDYLLECARLAPSAHNFQPWRFILVESEEKRNALHACYPAKWFAFAPLYIVVCADTEHSWKRECDGADHADIDAAIAAEHICLAATDKGLGSCWVCAFDVETCRRVLELPENEHPVVILPIGYPSNNDRPETRRKETEAIVSRI